jgi:hypothetical protein
VTESRSREKPNGPMSSSALKSSFLAKTPTTDATEVMPELLTPGFIKTTSPIKHALHIKHMAVTMDLVAHQF